jgi:FKBP-type peptidyl-prolyl cis-trans isomerase
MLVGLSVAFGCKGKDEPVKSHELTQQDANEIMVGANKERLRIEQKKIDAYQKRRNWEMQETPSGLRYFIYEHGSETLKVDTSQVAVINYEIELIDGTLCYSSDSTGTKGFTIGKGQIEKGIEEGVLLMNKGERAKFILPSHLGHGLMGDEVMIPSHAILVCDISLIDIH